MTTPPEDPHNKPAGDESDDDWLEMITKEMNDPAIRARRGRERRYLDKYIFQGLRRSEQLWLGPRSPYFDEVDFVTIIERCRAAGVYVNGVEVFTSDSDFLGINVPYREEDPTHEEFINQFTVGLEYKPDDYELCICASFMFEGVDLDVAPPGFSETEKR